MEAASWMGRQQGIGQNRVTNDGMSDREGCEWDLVEEDVPIVGGDREGR